MAQQHLSVPLTPALPPPAGARQELSVRSTPTSATHQPHHQVGEDSDPQRGKGEGEHEELLPAGLAAVGDGDAQEEDEWPGQHPLGFVPSCLCGGMGRSQKGGGEKHTLGYTPASLRVGLFFQAKQENATNVTPSNGLHRITHLHTVNLEAILARRLSVC